MEVTTSGLFPILRTSNYLALMRPSAISFRVFYVKPLFSRLSSLIDLNSERTFPIALESAIERTLSLKFNTVRLVFGFRHW